MRIPFRALVLSAGLMLSTVAYADVSAFDPELFLDPHEQETRALIATDILRAGETVAVGLLAPEPEVVAAVEATPVLEPQAEASAVPEPLPELSAADATAASEFDQVVATGSLPVVSIMQTEPTSSGEESEQVAMTSQSPVEPVPGTSEGTEDAPATSLP
jgi:hypothetical protein